MDENMFIDVMKTCHKEERPSIPISRRNRASRRKDDAWYEHAHSYQHSYQVVSPPLGRLFHPDGFGS